MTNEAFGGLVRRTTLKNTGDKAMKVSLSAPSHQPHSHPASLPPFPLLAPLAAIQTNRLQPRQPSYKISVLDGPARFEPFGVDDWHLKNMGRTLEAWINVENMGESRL